MNLSRTFGSGRIRDLGYCSTSSGPRVRSILICRARSERGRGDRGGEGRQACACALRRRTRRSTCGRAVSQIFTPRSRTLPHNMFVWHLAASGRAAPAAAAANLLLPQNLSRESLARSRVLLLCRHLIPILSYIPGEQSRSVRRVLIEASTPSGSHKRRETIAFKQVSFFFSLHP